MTPSVSHPSESVERERQAPGTLPHSPKPKLMDRPDALPLRPQRSACSRRLAFLVVLVGVASSTSANVYDGSLAAFGTQVATHGYDWPMPSRIDWFRARDGVRIRYAHWTPGPGLTPRGVVVFFSGRTEFIEKNVATYRDLLRRGFAVWTFDWRGQGLSDRLLTKPGDQDKGHVKSFDDYLRDAEYFIDRVVGLQSASGTKVLLAHSMGGQVALRYLLEHPGTFDRAVLTSPLLRVPGDVAVVRWANAVKIFMGLGSSCVAGKSPKWTSDFSVAACPLIAPGGSPSWQDAPRKPEASAQYTHDWEKLAQQTCLIEESRGATPNLGLACPTSCWLRAAFRSTDVTMTARSRLHTPTLIIPAQDDRAVDNAGQVDFCDDHTLTCCRAPEIDGAGHELLVEREPLRARVFALFDRFTGSDSTTSAKAFCAAIRAPATSAAPPNTAQRGY